MCTAVSQTPFLSALTCCSLAWEPFHPHAVGSIVSASPPPYDLGSLLFRGSSRNRPSGISPLHQPLSQACAPSAVIPMSCVTPHTPLPWASTAPFFQTVACALSPHTASLPRPLLGSPDCGVPAQHSEPDCSCLSSHFPYAPGSSGQIAHLSMLTSPTRIVLSLRSASMSPVVLT